MKVYYIIALLSLTACAQTRHSKTEAVNNSQIRKEIPVPEAGVVHQHISLRADSSYSYALYLPAMYDSAKKSFPVIYFFDAHKRGVLPVKKYAALAEKYGFILVGSNNSANRQTQIESDRVVFLLFDDVQQRFRVDKQCMVVSGFSGGSRVAAGIALFRKENVEGVIGCAAGFPTISLGYNTKFSYLAMVGNKDFNYLELNELDRALDQTPIPHYLLVYDGKHDWPPENVMAEGFEFMLFDAMRKGLIPKDESIVEEFLKRNDSLLVGANDVGEKVAIYRKINNFLHGLVPVEKYQAELNRLTKSDAYRSWQQKEKQQQLKEQNYQQKYASNMQVNNLHWWMHEIDSLNSMPDNPVSQRLLSYLSLISYMYASEAMRQNQLTAADMYLIIYENVDPENAEVYYLRAVWFVRTGKKQEALEQLQEAIDNGFNDYKRIIDSKDFEIFHGQPTFEKIVRQISAKSAP